MLACAAAFLTKLAGYAMPARWLHHPRMARVAGAITVALLSALTVMNTFAAGTALVIDARLAALAAAALLVGAGITALLGKKQVEQVSPPLVKTVESVKQDIHEVQEGRHHEHR